MRAVFVMMLVVVASCGGDDAQKTADASVDAFASVCGHPGDLGNEKGVGKFCLSLSDCSSTVDATICSVLGGADTHFCTRMCPMGNNTVCGTGAECTCNSSNQCGCTPSACFGP